MDQKLRDEFRAYKTETDDRLNRLEAAVKTLNGLVAPLYGLDDEKAPAPKPEAKKS